MVSGSIFTMGTESNLNRDNRVMVTPEMTDPDPDCPLCGHAGSTPYFRDRRRAYRQCPACALVFVPARFHLAAADEKALYDLHENAVDDPGYRRFLSRLAEPMLARLVAPARGLDFGCGPAPLLAELFREAGHDMAVYDLYYADHPAVLAGTYDFITSSETIEHLARPGEVFARWLDLLAPGGRLGIMTKRVIGREAFARWHYRNDPTHIAFFSTATFEFLARVHGLELEVVGHDVVIFRTSPYETGA